MPLAYGSNQRYRGTVELLVPGRSGVLMLGDLSALGDPGTLDALRNPDDLRKLLLERSRGGWEWRY